MTLVKDGVFGTYPDANQTLETVVDDTGTMYVRLNATWLTSPVMSTLSPTARGYEGTSPASTSCGQQSVSFVEERSAVTPGFSMQKKKPEARCLGLFVDTWKHGYPRLICAASNTPPPIH